RVLDRVDSDTDESRFGTGAQSFLFCGGETSRRQWCTERFDLSSTTSATLGLDGECRVGRGPLKEPQTYLDKPSRDLSVVWSASNERAEPSAMECQYTRLVGLRRSLA